MGFLGIREPANGEEAPGTVLLDTTAAPTSGAADHLQHAHGHHSELILEPQPSDDVNDPLNFSYSKKITMLAVTGLGVTIFGATVGPLLNAGLVQIAIELNVPVTKVVQASGYQLLVVAANVTILNAVACRWGKRPVFLASGLACLIGSIIGSTANTYNQLLAARIIQGFSSSAYESLVIAMIGDMFFVHERGLWTAAANFLLGAISNLSSVITGPITQYLGWRYLFHLLIAFGGLQTVLQFFLVPETQFRRKTETIATTQGVVEVSTSADAKHEMTTDVESKVHTERHEYQSGAHNKKKTFRQNLAIFSGTYSQTNLLTLIFGPFACCTNIAVLWNVLVTGYFLSLYVTISYLLAQTFAAPPYLLSTSAIGYLSLGPFLGGLIAAVIAGFLNDRIIRWCTHRNKGIYEPEYRLLLGVGGFLAIAGIVGFGFAAQAGKSFYLTAFLHGLGLGGIMFVFVSTSAYVLDGYSAMGNEIFLASMMFKNFIIYAYSYFVNDWAVKVGIAHVFWVLCSVAAGLLLTYPVVFFFGKQYRVYWSKHNLMDKFYAALSKR